MAKTRRARKGKAKGRFESVLRQEERALAAKFHEFLGAWNEHIREEILVHRQMERGRHADLKKHLRQTLKIHERFIKRLKKL